MVIRSFKDEEAARFFKTGKAPLRKGWASVGNIVKRKLDMLHYACDLSDLTSPPGNRLERLSGKWKDHYSIRINDQWRIVFRWDHQPFDVCVIDYH